MWLKVIIEERLKNTATKIRESDTNMEKSDIIEGP